MDNPVISVIIPLYNAKEYIGKCLDSLLVQTFQKFEVIVVDDCSKDDSVAIVKSYVPKFNGRLKLSTTKKNSCGGGYVPRNIGLNSARGEYIFFVDADDYLAENALETLSTAATENQADVVYTANHYDLSSSDEFNVIKDGRGEKLQRKNIEDKVVLILEEQDNHLQNFFSEKHFRTAWTKFVRRDLLTKNGITFPEITVGGDYLWSINVYCHAKRFLRLPTPIYFYRGYSEGFIARKKKKPREKVSFWAAAFVDWLKALKELASKINVIGNNSANYCKISLDYFKYCLSCISDEIVDRFYSKDTYEILFNKFAKEQDSSAFLVPFFFSAIANREKIIAKNQKNIETLTGDINHQQEKINSITIQAKRAKELEGEVSKQKKQIETLTTRAQRVKELEQELDNQKKQFDAQKAQVCPLVSIIIPMYNAEKFIGEALESILAQTLQNFEVIVVDDCSKDSSYKVVESYIPKFDGRLKLLQMAKNSGSAPAPRNKGFLFSRGEYIFFMDVDDAFTKTALEEMYTLAKDYNADVVYCEKYYMSTGSGKEFMKNIYPADTSIQYGDFVDKPTIISNDLAERLQELSERKFWVTPWQRLVSRELLTENNITFPEIIGSDDVVWCFQVLFCAKRFLRVPNSCYIRRMYDESFTKSKKPPNKHIRQWSDVTIRGLKFAANFMDRLKFFQENPDQRYKALNTLARSTFGPIAPICAKLKDEEIYDIFLNEFAKDTGEHSVLISYLCTRVCEEDKTYKKNQKEIKRLNEDAKKSQKRIAELEEEVRRLKSGGGGKVDLEPVIAPSNFTNPAISVVVPMYNAEEYIGECLDSLLIQTFQNFEVIVADDCSTDDSVKIVESYAPKFDGRLKLAHTKKNSGGGGYIPRNLGLTLASGEYVIFLDSDDFLLGTALETLYNAAKEYDAEVVYSSTYYNVVKPDDVQLYRDGLGRRMVKEGKEDKITFTVDDRHKIFQEFLVSSEGNFRNPWSKFVRRDFLLKNEITFPDIMTGGDCIWCINVYAYAKRFLRLPTTTYFYRRYNGTSLTRTMRSSEEQLSYWIEAFIAFLKALNNLTNRTEFLRENPSYCYEAVKGGHFEWCLNRTSDARDKLSNKDIYEVLYREFGKGNDLSAFAVPFFFSFIDAEKKTRKDHLKTISNLRKEVEQFKKAKK